MSCFGAVQIGISIFPVFDNDVVSNFQIPCCIADISTNPNMQYTQLLASKWINMFFQCSSQSYFTVSKRKLRSDWNLPAELHNQPINKSTCQYYVKNNYCKLSSVLIDAQLSNWRLCIPLKGCPNAEDATVRVRQTVNRFSTFVIKALGWPLVFPCSVQSKGTFWSGPVLVIVHFHFHVFFCVTSKSALQRTSTIQY